MSKLVTKLKKEFRNEFGRNLKPVTQITIENLCIQEAHVSTVSNKATFKATLIEEIMEREQLRDNQEEKIKKIVEKIV